MNRFLRAGASPRGAQALLLAGKVRALLSGRYNVSFDDIRAAFPPAMRHRVLLNFEAQADLAYALCNPGSGGRTHSRQLLDSRMAVRRLMPIECEKLQGFPPGFTAIIHNGKPAADGPRYRCLGNAMAVPVVKWILDRVRQFTELGL